MQRWHLLTGEYPPQPGGVADYSRQVARGLAAAGDDVVVWAPRHEGHEPRDEGVRVRRLTSRFGPTALAEIDAALAASPGRLLLQYTPHAFGCKAMNVPMCMWVSRRRMLDVMFHEVAFPFKPRRQPWRHSVLAAVQRGMASLLVRAAQRVFVSIPGWRPLLGNLAGRFPDPVWLPIPSNLPARPADTEIIALRERLRPHPTGRLVGHFGTYGPTITRTLEPTLIELLDTAATTRVVLLGRGGPAFRATLLKRRPAWSQRVVAPGELDGQGVGTYLAACDVLVQPYPDGISTRRGSAMAGLALGCPIVTTAGDLTEPLWQETQAVILAPSDGLAKAVDALANDLVRRAELGARAAALYRQRFALEHTIRRLRQDA